jgi:hypothetical protein
MKFLIDEDVPAKLLTVLKKLGHDCIRVASGTADPEIAKRAKKEEKILITLDKDFTNTSVYQPNEYNIIRIQIHPPYKDPIIEAFKKLLGSVSPKDIRGLIILQSKGHIRVVP